MSRPGTGMIEPLCATQFSDVRLRRRHLVVAAEPQLLVDDVENRVGAPVREIGLAAARPRAAAPLVGEHHFRAVVVERRRMPVREVLSVDRVEPLRMHRIGDVEQDAVARAGAGRQADRGIDRDVVALIGDRRVVCVPVAVLAALATGRSMRPSPRPRRCAAG